MLKIYGSMLCPDCVDCCRDLDAAGVEYQFADFADSLLNLKEFLKLRDENPVFLPVKEQGSIGIPCIVKEDGGITLDWAEFLPM
jgi:glutaredoxin-related protein